MSVVAPLAGTILFAILLFLFFLVSGHIFVWLTALLHRALRRRSERRHSDRGPLGFPVVTRSAEGPAVGPIPALPLANDGPGRYKVIGVASATVTDVEMYVDAATLANAKVKAELAGVIVTDLVKQPD